MSVLPRLERELIAAHERRAKRWRIGAIGQLRWGQVRTALALTASVAVVIAVVAVALTGHARVPRSRGLSIPPGVTTVLVRGLLNPQAYSSGSCLYVATHVNRPGANPEEKLMRLDPLSGRLLASRFLGAQFDHALLVNGELWVTTSTAANDTTLWGLNQATLAVDSRITLTGSGAGGAGPGSLAVAGGWLWVGSENALNRVSLLTGTVTRVVSIPGAHAVGVASDDSGRVLLVSVGSQIAHVQRRDPGSGALIGTSGSFDGVTQPFIGGVVGDYAWLSEATGMQGYAERIDLRGLNAAGNPTTLGTGRQTRTLIPGSNGVQARVIDGILWVSQIGGGEERNYCADPLSGRPRARLRFGRFSLLVTADSRFIYYEPSAQNEILRAPIDPRCR